MKVCLLCLVALGVSGTAAAASGEEPVRAFWGDRFTLNWNFTVPYIERLQKEGLT
jgi:hypothetical protein